MNREQLRQMVGEQYSAQTTTLREYLGQGYSPASYAADLTRFCGEGRSDEEREYIKHVVRQYIEDDLRQCNIMAAQMIRPYERPPWLVEPVGDASDDEDISAIAESDYEILDIQVLGWGPYNAIIRVEGGPDYLVQFG